MCPYRAVPGPLPWALADHSQAGSGGTRLLLGTDGHTSLALTIFWKSYSEYVCLLMLFSLHFLSQPCWDRLLLFVFGETFSVSILSM